MEKDSQQVHAGPLSKDDWVQFGAHQANARSKRAWRVIAVLAIFGLLAAVTTYIWLYKDYELRLDRLSNRHERAVTEKQQLMFRLSSVSKAVKDYTHLIDQIRTEKDQLTMEKGILQAQIRLLEAINAARDAAETEQQQNMDAEQGSEGMQSVAEELESNLTGEDFEP